MGIRLVGCGPPPPARDRACPSGAPSCGRLQPPLQPPRSPRPRRPDAGDEAPAKLGASSAPHEEHLRRGPARPRTAPHSPRSPPAAPPAAGLQPNNTARHNTAHPHDTPHACTCTQRVHFELWGVSSFSAAAIGGPPDSGQRSEREGAPGARNEASGAACNGARVHPPMAAAGNDETHGGQVRWHRSQAALQEREK